MKRRKSYSERDCFHSSWDLIDVLGSASVCPWYPNPSGRLGCRWVKEANS